MFKKRLPFYLISIIISLSFVSAQTYLQLGRSSFNAPDCFGLTPTGWVSLDCDWCLNKFGVIYGTGDNNDFLWLMCNNLSIDLDNDGKDDLTEDLCLDSESGNVDENGCTCQQKIDYGLCGVPDICTEFYCEDDSSQCSVKNKGEPCSYSCSENNCCNTDPIRIENTCGHYELIDNLCVFQHDDGCECIDSSAGLDCQDELYRKCFCLSQGNDICNEQWECGYPDYNSLTEWSVCTDGYKQRVCSDLNACGTILEKPTEQEVCSLVCDGYQRNPSNFSECQKLVWVDNECTATTITGTEKCNCDYTTYPCTDLIRQQCDATCSDCILEYDRPNGYNSASCSYTGPTSFCQIIHADINECYNYETDNPDYKKGDLDCENDELYQQVATECSNCSFDLYRDNFNGDKCYMKSQNTYCVIRDAPPCDCYTIDGNQQCGEDYLWTMCSDQCQNTQCLSGYHRESFNSNICGNYSLSDGKCNFVEADNPLHCLGIEGTDSCIDDPIKQLSGDCIISCELEFKRSFFNAYDCYYRNISTDCIWVQTLNHKCIDIEGNNVCGQDPIYTEFSATCNSDIDQDGIVDLQDNCLQIYNPEQLDTDADGIGDPCDACPYDDKNDIDNDGVCGDIDNCPYKHNPQQLDCDNDGIGDACDLDSACATDHDQDGVPDYLDNCPENYNPDQLDSDGDAIGDVCDYCPFDRFNDIDKDTICGNEDNCPFINNPDQTDSDYDGIGDACDVCIFDNNNDIDNDGVCGDTDNCPFKHNPQQLDCDNDGIGDACDLDSACVTDHDQDGVPDYLDNCPETYNPDQLDSDGDAIGNMCDFCPNDPLNDIDNDGICADIDNCIGIFNPDQIDSDNDGIGDMCDPCPYDDKNDIDNDGVCGNIDNCPLKNNPYQLDCDNDGIGDACDSESICTADFDQDAIPDNLDNCPETYNPDQLDSDGDAIGDACDICKYDAFNDIDGDGICGNIDNCPTISNQNQEDFDNDGIGNACDRCPYDPKNDVDGDGICGNIDNCPFNNNPYQLDCDNDGIGDACDPDSVCTADFDQDGRPDNLDNCPETYNPDQLDSDGDGIGDACDFCPLDKYNDLDNDGVCGNIDNCPLVYNPDQKNHDHDVLGNACDLCPNDSNNDIDEDGYCADVDNCPNLKNPNQEPCEDIKMLPEKAGSPVYLKLDKNDVQDIIQNSYGYIPINLTDNQINEYLNYLKKNVKIDKEEYYLNDRLFTKYRIIISTNKPITDFTYLQNIPKCISNKAQNIYFNGKNYNIIQQDPIVGWHFANVDKNIEITYDVEGKISDLCLDELKYFAYSTSEIMKPTNISLHIVFILIIITLLIFGYVIFEQKHTIKDSYDEIINSKILQIKQRYKTEDKDRVREILEKEGILKQHIDEILKRL